MQVLSDLLPEHKKINYKSAGKLPPLEIPPGLDPPARTTAMPCRTSARPEAATFSAYHAERSKHPIRRAATVLPSLERAGCAWSAPGTQRWLVVKRRTREIWPAVKDFWQENGFLVKLDLPEAGVMETEWAENARSMPERHHARVPRPRLLDSVYSTSERDKFRTRLERGDGRAPRSTSAIAAWMR